MELECPACGGREGEQETCGQCMGSGVLEFSGCPRQTVPADVWDFCRLAAHAEEGLLPLAGGTLDQCVSFMSGLATYRGEKAWAVEQVRGRRL